MVCKFCNSNMTPMLKGSPSGVASSPDCLHVSGISFQITDQDWECPKCEAKVLTRLSPSSGLCLGEAPLQIVNSLRQFTERLRSFLESSSHLITEPPEDDLHWTLVGFSWAIQIEQQPMDEEADEEWKIRHAYHGDCLIIQICDWVILRVFFDGTAVINARLLEVEPRTLVEKLESGDDSNYRESRQETETRRPISGFINLDSEAESLTSGTKQLEQIARIMATVDCDNEFCPIHYHDEGNPWEEFVSLMLKRP